MVSFRCGWDEFSNFPDRVWPAYSRSTASSRRKGSLRGNVWTKLRGDAEKPADRSHDSIREKFRVRELEYKGQSLLHPMPRRAKALLCFPMRPIRVGKATNDSGGVPWLLHSYTNSLRPLAAIFDSSEVGKRSMPRFAGLGCHQILSGFYDAPVDGIKPWLAAARSVKNIDGVMYTTWVGDYSKLEAFAKVAFNK